MTEQIKIRRDTAAHYTADAPILGQAEPAMEMDGQGTAGVRTKMGDGATAWASLPFLQSIADGSAAGTVVVPPLASGVTTGVSLTNGGTVTQLSLLGSVPAIPAGATILVTDAAAHVQEFSVGAGGTAGGLGVTGTPIVVPVTSATVTLNTGNNYAVQIGGSSFSMGFGNPNNAYGQNRSVYVNLLGTTTAASGSGFNTLWIKRAGVWVGIL